MASQGDAGQAPDTARGRSELPTLGLAVALVLSIGLGWRVARPDDSPKTMFCTADGYIRADGQMLHRDNFHGCQWVDDAGHPVPVDKNGRPTG